MALLAKLAVSLALFAVVLAAPPRSLRRPLYRDEFELDATELRERRADNEGFYVFRDASDEEPARGPAYETAFAPAFRPKQRIQTRQSAQAAPPRQTAKREGDNFFRPFKTWQSESYADSHYLSDYSAPNANYDPPGLIRVRKYSL